MEAGAREGGGSSGRVGRGGDGRDGLRGGRWARGHEGLWGCPGAGGCLEVRWEQRAERGPAARVQTHAQPRGVGPGRAVTE